MTGWLAFGVVWVFCGIANLNAYADELDWTDQKPTPLDAMLCIAMGPISTIVGTTARLWSWAVHRKWTLPTRPLKERGTEKTE